MTENLLTSPLTGAGYEDLTVTGVPNLKIQAKARGTGTIKIYQADGEQTRVYSVAVDSVNFSQVETGDAVVAGRNLFASSDIYWQQGTINSATGADSGAGNRIRNKSFMNLPNSSLHYYVSTYSNHYLGIFFYTPEFLFIRYSTELGVPWGNIAKVIETPAEDFYYKAILRRSDNANMTVADINEVTVKLESGSTATQWTPAHEDISGNVRVEVTGDVELEDIRLFVPRTTDAFQDAVTSTSRELSIKATIQTESDTFELEGSDFVGGTMSITSSIMDGGFELGRAIASNLTMTLMNLDGRWDNVILDGATVWPYAGIKLDDGTTEYVPMGTFIIDQPGRPYSVLGLQASDRMILLDRPFKSLGLAFPASHIQILQAISNACNVPLAPSVLSQININRIAPKAPEGDVSCRDIVSEIALMAAGFARMTRAGALEIVAIQAPTVENAYHMPSGSRFDFKQTSDPITISGLIYGEKLWGSRDYALEVGTLELLSPEDDTVLTPVYNQIAGFSYTAYSATYPGNPALDPGDVVLHDTRDERSILTLITKHTYKHGGKCTMQADGKSKTAIDYKSANDRRLSQVAAKIERETEERLTAYQQASAQLADLISMSMGLHRSEDLLPDGSTIYYMHDKPERSQSSIIWRLSANALTVSSDGGATWDGFTSDGNLIIKMISTIGLSAEWINTGRMTTERIDFSGRSLTEKLSDLDEADSELNQQIMDYKAGGSNLVLNSDFGNVQSPSATWWTEKNGTSCDLIKARFDTCDKLKNSGLTCARLLVYDW